MDPVTLVPIIGFGLSFLYKVLSELKRKNKQTDQTIEERIKNLTHSLEEATRLIGSIETEIKTRSTLASQLQKDIDQYSQLVQLKKPEVEAVAQLLRGELQKEGRSSFWKGVLLNFVFFILGAAASWIINILTMRF